jgi:hypothetical protein
LFPEVPVQLVIVEQGGNQKSQHEIDACSSDFLGPVHYMFRLEGIQPYFTRVEDIIEGQRRVVNGQDHEAPIYDGVYVHVVLEDLVDVPPNEVGNQIRNQNVPDFPDEE